MLVVRPTLLAVQPTFISKMAEMENKKYVTGMATIWPEDIQQEPVQAYFNAPQKHKYNARWLLFWQDRTGMSMQEQAEMVKPLTQTEYRVRDWLIGEIGIGNYVFVNQSEMCRRLNINKKNGSIAIKRLIELNILIQGPKSGRSNTYMVNPAFCFSGNLKNGIKARNEIKKGNILQFKNMSD